MQKIIPDRLQNLISESDYTGDVAKAFTKFVPLLGNNNTGLFFFPEYTDHGPDHIRGVLETAILLIPEKAWAALKPDDAVLLSISALLHDVAMVLTADGLLHLLTADDLPRIGKLDSTSWKDLFDEFFAEARRWDGQTLFHILGDRKDTHHNEDLTKDVVHIQQRLNPEDWTVRYRKFLGEFVRRHHARIAHEMARFGFPSSNRDSDLKLHGFSDDMADLGGLIARSHNMALRATYGYLDSEYDGHIICRGTHPLFLMVLLRIADYLQLDANRVNAGWRGVQRLRGPISQAEWNAHLSIREIRPDDNDPESLFISARPESAKTFIKIKKTLAGLQNELDSSWAVLSEVYGRREDLRDLAISLRRVRSNLEDAQQYVTAHSPTYFPIAASFDTAGASLLKLLIRPLYGDRPDIGVRELMQNALDAVRELRRLRELHPELSNVSQLNQEADVLISIDEAEDGYHYLTVSDKGIGMTPETVRDYFLKAGASFRQSDAWRRDFVRDDKSTVLRSGRFGIGAVAAFLLGDRIQLQTRNVHSKPEDSVAFEAGIDDDFVELKRITLPTIGTTVVIRLDTQTTERLSTRVDLWDWYVLENPIVERRFKGEILVQSSVLPNSFESGQHDDWGVVRHPDYKGIHWGYFSAGDEEMRLFCNGIRVVRQHDARTGIIWGPSSKQIPFRIPSVSVFDENGKLPLNLQRNRLETWWLPFSAELAEEVTKDYCAKLLAQAPSFPVSESLLYDQHRFDYHYEWHPFRGLSSLFATSTGTMIFHPWHIQQEDITHVIASTANLGAMSCFQDVLHSIEGCARWESPMHFLDWLRNSIMSPKEAALLSIEQEELPYIKGMRVLIVNVDLFFKDGVRRDYTLRKLRSRREWSLTHLGQKDYKLESGECVADDGIMRRIYAEWGQTQQEAGAIIELFLDPSKMEIAESPFTKVWSEIMKKAVIPYDVAKRQREFAEAYESLKDYLALWRDPTQGTWRHESLLLNRFRI